MHSGTGWKNILQILVYGNPTGISQALIPTPVCAPSENHDHHPLKQAFEHWASATKEEIAQQQANRTTGNSHTPFSYQLL
jgi:hypothetical protein